jgi:hypothetical protein
MSDAPSGRRFWVCLAIGWAAIAFGLLTVFTSRGTRPPSFALWFLGLLVVHDAVVAPLVLGIGVVLGRRVRGRARTALCGALVLTGVLALVSWTQLRGYGLQPDNPSLMPNDYAAGLALVVGVVWAVTVVLLVRAARPRGAGPRTGARGRRAREARIGEVGPAPEGPA